GAPRSASFSRASDAGRDGHVGDSRSASLSRASDAGRGGHAGRGGQVGGPRSASGETSATPIPVLTRRTAQRVCASQRSPRGAAGLESPADSVLASQGQGTLTPSARPVQSIAPGPIVTAAKPPRVVAPRVPRVYRSPRDVSRSRAHPRPGGPGNFALGLMT